MTIENVIIKNSAWNDEDIATLFGDLDGNVEPVFFAESDELSALMREMGIFPCEQSTTSRPSWQNPRGLDSRI